MPKTKERNLYADRVAPPVRCAACHDEMPDRMLAFRFDSEGRHDYTHTDEGCPEKYITSLAQGLEIQTTRRAVSLHHVKPVSLKVIFCDRVDQDEIMRHLEKAGCYDVSDVSLGGEPVDMYYVTAKTLETVEDVNAHMLTVMPKKLVGVVKDEEKTNDPV